MTVTRDIAATRQRVWDVLANGWTYSGWVVGNSRIRAVDSNWPAPGTRILHSIGTWPAVIDDETVVEHSIPGEELVLMAKTRPAAKARITLQLTDLPDGGCRVAMTEVVVSRSAALGARHLATARRGSPQPRMHLALRPRSPNKQVPDADLKA